MNEGRISEIKNQLTDEQRFIEFLCSLPEERYQHVFRIMKLVKLLDMQKISQYDKEFADDVYQAYATEGIITVTLMAYMYGKVQGKREIRKKKRRE